MALSITGPRRLSFPLSDFPCKHYLLMRSQLLEILIGCARNSFLYAFLCFDLLWLHQHTEFLGCIGKLLGKGEITMVVLGEFKVNSQVEYSQPIYSSAYFYFKPTGTSSKPVPQLRQSTCIKALSFNVSV